MIDWEEAVGAIMTFVFFGSVFFAIWSTVDDHRREKKYPCLAGHTTKVHYTGSVVYITVGGVQVPIITPDQDVDVFTCDKHQLPTPEKP